MKRVFRVISCLWLWPLVITPDSLGLMTFLFIYEEYLRKKLFRNARARDVQKDVFFGFDNSESSTAFEGTHIFRRVIFLYLVGA